MWYNIVKYKFIIESCIIFILSYLISLTRISNIIKIYFRFLPPIIYVFLSLLVFYYFIKTIINKDNLIYLIITYFIFLLIILFLRKPSNLNVEEKFYLFKWIKLLLKDRTIFINVIGNVLIFIPYGFILRMLSKSKYLILLSILPIVLIELIQFVTLLGIFDIIDIILNFIGTLIGMLGEGNMYESGTKRRKKRTTQSRTR